MMAGSRIVAGGALLVAAGLAWPSGPGSGFDIASIETPIGANTEAAPESVPVDEAAAAASEATALRIGQAAGGSPGALNFMGSIEDEPGAASTTISGGDRAKIAESSSPDPSAATSPDPSTDTSSDPRASSTRVTSAGAAAAASPTTAGATVAARRQPASSGSSPTTARTATTAGTTTTRRVTTTKAPTTAGPTSAGNTCATGAEFETVMWDDFNGSSVNTGIWSVWDNAGGNGGYGRRMASQVAVQNGKLVITARNDSNGSLISGGMNHQYGQTYGRYRVKVRTDNDPSMAVSGVVLTWPVSNAHPRDGENNIYETLVERPGRNPFYTFIHEPYGTTSDQIYLPHHADGSQWQVMTMEWTPDKMTITREGPGGAQYRQVHVFNETADDLLPDVPHRLHIQLDGWKHAIGQDVRMEVDWVEVARYCG